MARPEWLSERTISEDQAEAVNLTAGTQARIFVIDADRAFPELQRKIAELHDEGAPPEDAHVFDTMSLLARLEAEYALRQEEDYKEGTILFSIQGDKERWSSEKIRRQDQEEGRAASMQEEERDPHADSVEYFKAMHPEDPDEVESRSARVFLRSQRSFNRYGHVAVEPAVEGNR